MKEEQRNMKQQKYQCLRSRYFHLGCKNLFVTNPCYCLLQSLELSLQARPFLSLSSSTMGTSVSSSSSMRGFIRFEVIVKNCCSNHDNVASSWLKVQCVSETLETAQVLQHFVHLFRTSFYGSCIPQHLL